MQCVSRPGIRAGRERVTAVGRVHGHCHRAPHGATLDHLFQVEPLELSGGLDNHCPTQRGRSRLGVGLGLFEKLDAAGKPVLQARKSTLYPLRDVHVARPMGQRQKEVAISGPNEHGEKRQRAHDADAAVLEMDQVVGQAQ